MHDVKVSKLKLLETVQLNRQSHREQFLKAQEGYREEVIAELDKMLEDARKGKSFRTSIALPAPQDHTEDYNRIIAMLEMSVDDVIELDATTFDQYVLDNWHWKGAVSSTNSRYIK